MDAQKERKFCFYDLPQERCSLLFISFYNLFRDKCRLRKHMGEIERDLADRFEGHPAFFSQSI